VLGAGGEDLGGAAHHEPSEAAPVFVPAVDDKGGLRVFQDVADRFNGMSRRFGFSSTVM